jgi:hypothetical protein
MNLSAACAAVKASGRPRHPEIRTGEKAVTLRVCAAAPGRGLRKAICATGGVPDSVSPLGRLVPPLRMMPRHGSR